MEPILALDLAVRTGVAFGFPGAGPDSCTVVLKREGQGRNVALGNFVDWLAARLRNAPPSVLVTEAPLPLQAFKATRNSEATVRLTYGLCGVAEAIAYRFGVPHVEVSVNVVRKHFLGRANLGSREATKLAVVSRCQVLGYIPRDCKDDNRADACAVWDWASTHLARVPPHGLHLFGESAA